MVTEETKKLKNKAKASLTLLLVAVISITTATYAWFSISNSTTVKNMEIQVGAGVHLKVGILDSNNMDDFTDKLTNDDVNSALKTAFGFTNGLSDIKLWPVTSGNGYTLYTRSGNQSNKPSEASAKYYLELPLYFRATADMAVYLNGEDSESGMAEADQDGTKVYSVDTNSAAQAQVDHAVRISFTTYNGNTAGESVIYEPNKNGGTTLTNSARSDGGNTQNTFVDLGDNTGTKTNSATGAPVLFKLAKDTTQKVVIRIWIEGEDPQCVNGNGTGSDVNINLEAAKLIARFRFCGADENGNFMEGAAG